MSLLQCISLSDMTPSHLPPTAVVCLGNFDGVHLAHRALMEETRTLRNLRFPNAACSVFCFRVPSSDYLFSTPPAHLSTLEQKLKRFREVGMEYAILTDFPDIQDLTPKEFVFQILKDGCHCVAAVCGFNYRFGKDGKGNAEMLRTLLEGPVSVQNEIRFDGETVSSTRIRHLLLTGEAEKAAILLCHPYSFSAEVVHGKSLGHKFGVPTVNQYFPPKMLIPRHGVYITDCEIDGQHYRGVSNVGVHPTVDDDALVNCETHLLECSMDLYGQNVTVNFLKFLRPELKFDSIDDLKQQIQADIRSAKNHR